MDERDSPNIDIYSFDKETRFAIYSVMKPYFEFANAVHNSIVSFVKPFMEFVERAAQIVKILSPEIEKYLAILKLAEVQYVNFGHIDTDFAKQINEADNVNKILRQTHEQNKYRQVNNTIRLCGDHALMHTYKKMFSQAILAYRNKHNELAIVGFLAVIDGLLTDVSKDSATSIFNRANIILEKAVKSETIDFDDEELHVLALTITFVKTVELLSAQSDFNGKEPPSLNRHWIMHGRSRRRKTKLDCIKLIHFIYGILLIHDFSITGSINT